MFAGVPNEPDPAPKTGAAPNPDAAGAPALALELPNAGGLAALAPKTGAELVPNEGTAPKLGAAPALLLLVALPKMLLLAAATGAVAAAAVVVGVGAAPPNENAPLVLFAAVMPDDCAVAPNEKLELADGTAPKVVVGLVAEAAAPKMPAEGEVTVEKLELATLPNAGGAVVGGAAVVAAPKPPKDGVAAGAAVVVVVAAPNEGMADVEVVPNGNLGAAVLLAPKAGGAAELAPPNENALVVVAVAGDDDTAGFGMLLVPNEKPPADVRVVAGIVVPEVDAVIPPKEGAAEDAVLAVTVEEAVGDRGLKALNPEPLPKAGIWDLVVVKVF